MVTEAQPLMVIVPDGAQVTAEVTLENKDIGFVSPTQEATIKLETFSYTRHGTVNATVKTVTTNAVNDGKRGSIFPVTLNLGATTIDVDGKPIKLSPEMNLTAEFKTGKRRVIEFLLGPVQRATSELERTMMKRTMNTCSRYQHRICEAGCGHAGAPIAAGQKYKSI